MIDFLYIYTTIVMDCTHLADTECTEGELHLAYCVDGIAGEVAMSV